MRIKKDKRSGLDKAMDTIAKISKQPEPKVGKGKKALIGAGLVSAVVAVAAATTKKGEAS